ncbi:ABC transporter ATP-binding protein [Candidatus Saccharibacteria bacterium]|nr:ABC transporter ATP-binding protein [Candidatus Saccharibacteria bacterium]
MRQRRRIKLTIDDLKVRRSKYFQLTVPYLHFLPGVVTCIVGANGSGKTTLVESIVGLIRPTQGRVIVSGYDTNKDIIQVKRSIGYIPDDEDWIIPELSAREYFSLLISVQDQTRLRVLNKRVVELADELMFSSFNQQLGDLSHGNIKKVQIIAGLLHDPSFLVVDELSNGLDPIAIDRAERLLRRKMYGGTCIIAATHDLYWAERFAKEIIMIAKGHVVLNDYTENIISRSGSLANRFMEVYADVKQPAI